jgi:hypothetical protein
MSYMVVSVHVTMHEHVHMHLHLDVHVHVHAHVQVHVYGKHNIGRSSIAFYLPYAGSSVSEPQSCERP